MKTSFLEILMLISFIVLCPLSSPAADEESLAQQAEQAGKLREALTHYVSALQSASPIIPGTAYLIFGIDDKKAFEVNSLHWKNRFYTQ